MVTSSIFAAFNLSLGVWCCNFFFMHFVQTPRALGVSDFFGAHIGLLGGA